MPAGTAPAIERPSEEVFPGGRYDRPWEPGRPGEPLIVEYAAGGAWAALDGSGTVTVAVDGGAESSIELDGPGLYELAAHPAHGMHAVRIELGGPIRVWSVSFAPGAAG